MTTSAAATKNAAAPRAPARSGGQRQRYLGEHGLVLGGGIAGLLAARVLATHFRHVTVIDRDALDSESAERRGAAQTAHGHSLLMSGGRICEALFPGLTAELAAGGAIPIDFISDFRFFHFGVWKSRDPSHLAGTQQSRGLLERHLRQRLLQWRNVELREACAARDVLIEGDRIVGVVANHHGGGASGHQEIRADLVVDASGYGSRVAAWMHRYGYPKVEETRIHIDLRYASCFYRPPPEPRDWKAMVVYPRPPAERRAGYIFEVEDNRWQVTLTGYLGDQPPIDPRAFLAFARTLPQPDIYEALRDAQPISEVRRYRVPAAVRRHYERLQPAPQGWIAFGDAACRLDPSFAHGMSVIAKQALLLDRCLAQEGRGRAPLRSGFARRFHRRSARLLDWPWLIIASEAYRHPEIPGRRRLIHQLMQWFAGRIYELSAATDVHQASFEVMHLVRGLPALLSPSILRRVLFARGRAPSELASRGLETGASTPRAVARR